MTEELGYEAARAELADVVRRLESGGQTLEESLVLWERGEELADICQRWLRDATVRLDTPSPLATAPRATQRRRNLIDGPARNLGVTEVWEDDGASDAGPSARARVRLRRLEPPT